MIPRWNTHFDAQTAAQEAVEGLEHILGYRITYTVGIGYQVVITDRETGKGMGFYCPVVEVTEEARTMALNPRAVEYASKISPSAINGDGLTFAQYLTNADAICTRATDGAGIFDLADADWWTNWDDCAPASNAVHDLLIDEGYPGLED